MENSLELATQAKTMRLAQEPLSASTCPSPVLAGVASALAQHALVREWRRRNRAERHVDRRARKSVER